MELNNTNLDFYPDIAHTSELSIPEDKAGLGAESLALARLWSPKKPTPNGGADTPVSPCSLRHKSHSTWIVGWKQRALNKYLSAHARSYWAWSFWRAEALWQDNDELLS